MLFYVKELKDHLQVNTRINLIKEPIYVSNVMPHFTNLIQNFIRVVDGLVLTMK